MKNRPCSNRNGLVYLRRDTCRQKSTKSTHKYIVSSSEQLINQNIYSVLAVIFIPKIERKMILWQKKDERNTQKCQTVTARYHISDPADATLMQSIHQQANTTLLPDR